jgi:hypothetical protein
MTKIAREKDLDPRICQLEKGKKKEEKETYQGIPKFICVCTVMKYAFMPRTVDEPTIIMKSQKFSCTAGQWYFVLIRRTTSSVIVDSVVEAIADYSGVRGGGERCGGERLECRGVFAECRWSRRS